MSDQEKDPYEGDTPGRKPDEEPTKGEGVEPGETNVSGGEGAPETDVSAPIGDGPYGGQNPEPGGV